MICVTFVLAWIGYKEYFSDKGIQANTLDLFFCSIDMFRAAYRFDPGPKPVALGISQVLSPAVTLYTLSLASLFLLRGKLRLRFASKHAVICGLGENTIFLIRELKKNNTKAVVVDETEDTSLEQTCIELGATVVHGSPTSEETLLLARVNKAIIFIAALGDDTKNIEAAFAAFSAISQHAPDGETFYCHIHLENTEWCTSFRGFKELTQSIERFEPIVFNSFQNIARVALHRNPLDRVRILPDDSLQVHLVLVGFEKLGNAIAVQLAHTAHFANLKKPRLTVLDTDITEKRDQFLCRYPQFTRVVDVDFVEGNPGTPKTRELLTEIALDESYLVTVAVCKDSITECIVDALGLPPEFRDQKVPVLVRLNELNADTNFSRFTSEGEAYLIPFAFREDAIDLDFKIDELARGFHEMYLDRAHLEGQRAETNLAMCEWPRLDYRFKVSNRRLADHIDIKLRAVGCKMVPLSEVPVEARDFKFTDDEIEILARMEHARWAAERYMDGWRLGPIDKSRGITPYLIPYDDLEMNIQEYDREPMRQMPNMLTKHFNLAIVREANSGECAT